MRLRPALGGLGLAGLAGVARYWRKNPSACPYAGRIFLSLPRPIITATRLEDILAPLPGERLLEIGPGTGHYTLGVARRLLPGGTLEILDVQERMLDHTLRRAQERGLANVVPGLGDAGELPFDEDRFDGAFLVTVLAEIPDQYRALAELHRVVRHGGRVVVGEIFGDPHMVGYSTLMDLAVRIDLQPDERVGGRLGYFARFRVNKPGRVYARRVVSP
ncbi:MAG: class I SAM-dependent methyltransferase [Actinomycetota bacterium]